MWARIRDAFGSGINWCLALNQSEWFLLFIAVVVVGLFCLRGYGSRSSY